MVNREIKFRAWDNRQKIMFYFFRICKPRDSGTLAWECKDAYHNEWELSNWDDIVISQNTGLKDKNGKEIYDGDVILNPKATSPEDKGWLITWQNYGFEAKCIDAPYSGKTVFEHSHDFLVIGNIYENPELLKL